MHYVAGFMFRPGFRGGQVALIRKARPGYLAGMLNGIGSGVERGETPVEAMVREMKEESGVRTSYTDWTLFATLNTRREDRVDFFYANGSVGLYKNTDIESLTDEPVSWYFVDELDREKTTPNLRFLVPMARAYMRGELAGHLHIIENAS